VLLRLGGKRVCHDLSLPFAFDFEIVANGCKVDRFALAMVGGQQCVSKH